MTIICYRNGIMASDSSAWHGDAMVNDKSRKLFKVRGHLMGSIGDKGLTCDVVEKFRATGKLDPSKLTDTDAVMVVTPERKLLCLGCGVIEPMNGYPFFADGSTARMIALGAFHMGATAVQACRIAMKTGPWVGGAMQVIRL